MNESLNEKIESPQLRLKVRLLNGGIDPLDFIDELENLDQSTSDRHHASTNLEILEDPEVAALFKDGNESRRYYGFLSFTYFHNAQIRLHSDSLEGAVSDLKKSLEGARLEESNDPTWVAYVFATLAYVEGDIDELKKQNTLLEGARNQRFTRALIRGLESRGFPDYKEDYGSPVRDEG